MKNNILFPIILIISLSACQEDNETIYAVDPQIGPFVETFYAEASERGITVPKNLVAEFKDIQGISETQVNQGQNHLYIKELLFNTIDDRQVEAHIYYRLGAMLLRKENSDGISFMNPAYMFEPYNPVNKEAMFDNLFN